MEKLVDEKINKIVDTNLMGVIEITYMDDQLIINTVHLPGVLIDSTLVLIPSHPVLDLIKNKSNAIIRFHLTFTEFNRKCFVDAIEQNEVRQLHFLSDLQLNFQSAWKLIVLKYNIGNFMQKSNIIYYYMENLNSQHIRSEMLIFGYTIHKDDNNISMSYSVVKEYFVTEDKVYINFDFKDVSKGILFSKDKKIVGVYIEKRNRIITVRQLEKLINEKSSHDDNGFIHQFKTNFKNNLDDDSKLIEMDQFTNTDLNAFSSCLKNYTKESLVLNGGSSTLSNYFNHFRKYFSSWERVKTLIAVGPELIEKLCRQFKISSSTISVNLLMQMIITENKYNLDENNEIRKNLDLSNLSIDYPHFSSVIYSFFYDNLVYIDLTNIKFDSNVTKILANFLYKNCSLDTLILERTGIKSSQLFEIITAIRQSKNKSFSTLNLSHNNLNEDICESEITLDNPGQFLFSIELCRIHSLKELIMTDVRPQSHISTIFRLMHEFSIRSRIKSKENGESENEISLKMINLSNIPFSNTVSNYKMYSFTSISDFLFLNRSIEQIYLPNCNLRDEEIKLLIQSLPKKKSKFLKPDETHGINYLKILDLSRNMITAKGAVYIKNYLMSLTTKEKMHNRKFSESRGESDSENNVHDNQIEIFNSSTDGFKNLINNNEEGFSLYLNNIPTLEPEGVSIICEGITGSSIYMHLYLNNIKIKTEGLDALYNTIKIGNPIKSLSIALNSLNDYDIDSNFIQIFSDYNNSCCLTSLDIHGNNISNEKIINLVNHTQKYSQYKDVNPCEIICDPIDFSYLKYLHKDKISNELTQGYTLNTHHEEFDEQIKLVKSLSFYYSKNKKNKIKKNKIS